MRSSIADQRTAEDRSSVYSLLVAAAARAPEATAITFVASMESEPVRLTYGAFLGRLHRLARLLRELGVARGDVVSLLAPSIPDAVVALWAAATVGIAHPMNTLLRAGDIAAMMRAAGSQVLVALGPQAGSDLWDKAVAAAQATPCLRAIIALGDADPGAGYVHLNSCLPREDGPLDDPPASSDIAALFHTGGTSGEPKLARHTHANQVFVAQALAATLDYNASTRIVNGMPLFHVAGAIDCCLSPLAAGGEVLLPTAAGLRNPKVVTSQWRMVERFRPTIIGGIPTSLVALLNIPTNGADLSSLRCCVTGGAMLPTSLGEQFAKHIGVPVHQIYGMTECAGLIAVASVHADPITGTVGTAAPGVEINVRRALADGKVGECVLPGESGVLVVRGPNVFPGYLGNAPAVFTEDGWLITGDLGSVAVDGLVRLTGRVKDLIIRGGHNIDPAVIEDAAASHMQVVTSAAVGRPDAYAGEVPMLYVVLRANTPEILADLHAHMGKTVPEPPARPKWIVPLPALPITAAGKVDKPALRRDAAVRAAEESISALPGFAGPAVTVSARGGPSGRVVVTVSLSQASGVGPGLTEAAARLLSGFPFDHEIVFRHEATRR
ncbi:MAG: AMP-binding protein [Alphaproteobacteria bacterium]|nr:AMP-binding protein [Alphaproteobacteria bacterium]